MIAEVLRKEGERRGFELARGLPFLRRVKVAWRVLRGSPAVRVERAADRRAGDVSANTAGDGPSS